MLKVLFIGVVLFAFYVNAMKDSKIHYAFDNEVFNPDVGVLSKKYAYRVPSQSPFMDREEERRFIKKDPWLSDTPKYTNRFNFYEARGLQLEWMDAEKKGFTTRYEKLNRALMQNAPSHRAIRHAVSREHPVTGARTSLEIDALLIDGVVNLAWEQSVVSVKCLSKKAIEVEFENVDVAKRWIPGSRLVIEQKWDCTRFSDEPHTQAAHIFTLVKGRTLVSENTIRYDVEPLEQNEMFIRSSIKVRHQPKRLEQGQFDSTLSDQRMLRQVSKLYDAPSSWAGPTERQQSVNERYYVLKEQRFDLLNFNYNRNTGRAEKSFDIFRYGSGGFSSSSVCSNCFVYIYFDFLFEFDSTFLRIDKLRAEVGGGNQFRFETNTLLQYSYDNTWTYKIFSKTLGNIAFSAGPIPIYIRPELDLKAQLQAKVSAKFHMTHVASYSETIAFGIDYHYQTGMKRVNRRGAPRLTIGKPQISDDSQASGFLKFTLIPTLRLNFYSVAPLDLTFLPYVKLKAQLGNTVCGRWGASYETLWGLQLRLQMQVLKIPDSIYGIGGKTFDLGGILPYPKSERDALFTIVSESPLQCSSCSGCVDLIKVLTNSKREIVDSFESKRMIQSRSIVGETTHVDIGSDTEESLGIDQCKVYKLEQSLPSGFEYMQADSREILVDVEFSKGNGMVYWSQSEQDVKDKSTSHSSPVTSEDPLNIHEKWSTLFVSVCSTHEESTYQLITKPHATVAFGSSTKSVTLPKNKGLKYTFMLPKDSKELSHVEFNLLTKSGDVDCRVLLYAAKTGEPLKLMDDRSLVLDVRGKNEETLLQVDPQYPHSQYDYVVVANVLGREASEDNIFTMRADSLISTYIGESIVPTINRVRVYKTEAEFKDIMKFQMILKKKTGTDQTGTTTVCIRDKEQCFTVSNAEVNYFDYTIPRQEIETGMEFQEFEISGDGLDLFLLNEFRWTRSGIMERIRIRSNSHGGARVVLFKPSVHSQYDADEFLLSGKVKHIAKNVCTNCNIELKVFLVDNSNRHMDTVKYETSIRSVDGIVASSLNLKDIASEIGEDINKVRQYYLVTQFLSTDDAYRFELTFYEVSYISDNNREISSSIENSGSEELHVYKLPKSFLEKMGRGVVLKVSAQRPGGNSDIRKMGRPMILVQKHEVPNHSSFWISRSTSDTQIVQGFRLPKNDLDNVYAAVTTYSESLHYKVSFEELPQASVQVKLQSGKKTGKDFSASDFQNHGLVIEMTLNSPHAWKGNVMEKERLISLFDIVKGNTPDWKSFQKHMEDSLEKAIEAGKFAEFAVYDEDKLVFNIPPFKKFSLANGKLVLTLPPTIDHQLLSTEDDTNVVVDNRYEVSSPSSLPHGFWFVLVSVIAFIVAVSCFAGCVVTIVGCTIAGKKEKLSKPKIPTSHVSEKQKSLLEEFKQENAAITEVPLAVE